MNMMVTDLRDTPVREIDPREGNSVFSRIFDGKKGLDFSAWNDAVEFLHARGFSIGSPCFGQPCGVLYGDWQISKWRNLTSEQRAQLHGTVSGDRRTGPVKVAIFWNAPAFGIAAVAEPYIADRIVSTWATQR